VRAKLRADGGDARDAVEHFENALRDGRYANETAAIEQLTLARSAGDGDFYQLSVIDARLKELRNQHTQEMKDMKR
jgi:predicted Zn-dependent protease